MDKEPTQLSALVSSKAERVYLCSSGMLLLCLKSDLKLVFWAFNFWYSFSSFSYFVRILSRSFEIWSHRRSRVEICRLCWSMVSCISSICFFFLSRDVCAATRFLSFFRCTFSSYDKWSSFRLRPGIGPVWVLFSLPEHSDSESIFCWTFGIKIFVDIILEYYLFSTWWLGNQLKLLDDNFRFSFAIRWFSSFIWTFSRVTSRFLSLWIAFEDKIEFALMFLHKYFFLMQSKRKENKNCRVLFRLAEILLRNSSV